MSWYKVIARKRSDPSKFAELAVLAESEEDAARIVREEMGDHLDLEVDGRLSDDRPIIMQIGGNVIAIGGTLADKKGE